MCATKKHAVIKPKNLLLLVGKEFEHYDAAAGELAPGGVPFGFFPGEKGVLVGVPQLALIGLLQHAH